MKHRHYNGIKILLLGRDITSHNKLLLWRLTLLKILRAILGFLSVSSFTFSDHNFCLISAATSLDVLDMHCVHYIIGTSVIFLLLLIAEFYDVYDICRLDF